MRCKELLKNYKQRMSTGQNTVTLNNISTGINTENIDSLKPLLPKTRLRRKRRGGKRITRKIRTGLDQ